MTIQFLKYIVTVAEVGSITEAARKLNISQPRLSNAIKEAEKMHIGYVLCKGQELSELGQVYASALTGYVTPYNRSYVVLLFFELSIATLSWIGAGMLLQKIYMKYYKIINIILALTLLECIWSMLTMKV